LKLRVIIEWDKLSFWVLSDEVGPVAFLLATPNKQNREALKLQRGRGCHPTACLIKRERIAVYTATTRPP